MLANLQSAPPDLSSVTAQLLGAAQPPPAQPPPAVAPAPPPQPPPQPPPEPGPLDSLFKAGGHGGMPMGLQGPLPGDMGQTPQGAVDLQVGLCGRCGHWAAAIRMSCAVNVFVLTRNSSDAVSCACRG